jgi:PAS domain S-box-containing protein
MKGGAMATPIKVLLIEDQPDDAELMMAQLGDAGFETNWRRVETKNDYLENLDPALDLILADFNLPQFDAAQALQLLRERNLDIPFIIVSGVVKEEFIVEAIKLGASDFLVKDHMARLGVAVQQAIDCKRLRNLQKQTKQALNDIEQRYGTLARVSPVGILHFDSKGHCLDVNERWCAVSGLEAKRAIGEGWTGTLHPDDRENVLVTWCEAVRKQTAFNQEHRFRHSDGSVTWVINQAVPELTEDGKLRGFVGIVTDITKQKNIEVALRDSEEKGRRMCQQLEQTNRKLAELYKTAQRFVEDVSHEFRTPLTVIKGYVEAMIGALAGPITVEQKEYLGYVSDRTRDLAQMVDDLLDSSKLRAGIMRVDRKRTRAQEIVAQARLIIMSKAAANQIEVIEQLDADLPDVYADAEKAARILVNFAVNAIKFSPTGENITLWARRNAEGGAEIGVTDHGPGISLENQKLLFERFRQVGDSQLGASSGFGLGLNIARDLVALNLGQIHLVSSPGQGSTFSFTLPANDSRVVLQAYLDYLRLLPARVGTIGLLGVEYRSPQGSDDNFRDVLTAALKPTDLVFDGREEGSFRLIGYTDDLSGWVNRMRKVAAKFASQLISSNALDPVHIDVISAWPWPGLEDQAVARIVEEFSRGELVHA